MFDGSSLDDVTRLLIEARHRLETKGWFQGNYVSPEGAVCVLGSLGWRDEWEFVEDSKEEHPVEYMAALTLAKYTASLAGSVSHIPHWNDHPNTKLKDVYAAFDRAIENAAWENTRKG